MNCNRMYVSSIEAFCSIKYLYQYRKSYRAYRWNNEAQCSHAPRLAQINSQHGILIVICKNDMNRFGENRIHSRIVEA
jgi:hypothetical protein